MIVKDLGQVEPLVELTGADAADEGSPLFFGEDEDSAGRVLGVAHCGPARAANDLDAATIRVAE